MIADNSIWELQLDENHPFVLGRPVMRVDPAVPAYASFPKDTLANMVASTTGEYPPITLGTPDGMQVLTSSFIYPSSKML